MESDNKSTKTSSSGGSGGSRRAMSLRRLFKPSDGPPPERSQSVRSPRPSILPVPNTSKPAQRPTEILSTPNKLAPARPLVGGFPSAFMSLGMAAYATPAVPGQNPEPEHSQQIPTPISEPVVPVVEVPKPIPMATKLVDVEPDVSDYFDRRADWSRAVGRNVLEKRRGSLAEVNPDGNAAQTGSTSGFVLSYSAVEIDYINGHTIQAHTWQPGGLTFIRLIPTTAPLPPLVVPPSCLTPDAEFYITIHLSTSTKQELLHIESSIDYTTLLRKVGAHYECDLVAEDGTSTIGLGLSTKAWNGIDTEKWAEKLKNVENVTDQDEEYIEMILSVDTPEKWAWCLGIARQALKVRGLTSPEMRRVGVEMWLINEEGDSYLQVTGSP